MTPFQKGVSVFLQRFKRRFPDTAFIWKEYNSGFGHLYHECFDLSGQMIFRIMNYSERGHEILSLSSFTLENAIHFTKRKNNWPKFRQAGCFISAEIMRAWMLKSKKASN